MSGFSDSSCGTIGILFKSDFPDSKIVVDFAIGEDKICYVVSYAIAPYFKGMPANEVKKTPC